MKKIIAVLFLMLLVVPFVKADENINISDEEIMSVLEKYNLDGEQKDFLFKEVKKKIQEGFIETAIIQDMVKKFNETNFSADK